MISLKTIIYLQIQTIYQFCEELKSWGAAEAFDFSEISKYSEILYNL